MRRRQGYAKTKIETLSVVDLVDGLERFGATFRFTGAGSLLIGNLGKAPAALRQAFLDCDAKLLVAWLKSRAGAIALKRNPPDFERSDADERQGSPGDGKSNPGHLQNK